MNRFLFLIDKYKFGIIAVFAAYMFLFVYLQMKSYTQYFPITPFHQGPTLEKEEEIELEPEQVEVSPEMAGNIKNMSRDKNDARERSYENYSSNKSANQVEQSVKDYEKKLFEEAGGDKERKKIQEQMDQQKKQANSAPKKVVTPAKTGGDKAYAGNVMVEWSLSNRNPHQNNNYFVRNPGYTCGYGSNGVVAISIKVNQNGDVTSAEYQGDRSSGANSCMIEQALKYAKMSRFMYSGSAPSSQIGSITYRFVSQ
ncbi:MAG: hypothetical protein KJ941_11780 [Bacteroidetes bacterium]|nr:hypothetical protein [Bacteroidota bacterium]